jgi:protein Tob/BTG
MIQSYSFSNGIPVELTLGINWWRQQLDSSIPFNACQAFEESLLKQCTSKFDNHWYPNMPQKGQAFRSIAYDPTSRPDPLLVKASTDANLNLDTCFPKYMENCTMWIDPNSVVVRTSWSYNAKVTEEVLFPVARKPSPPNSKSRSTTSSSRQAAAASFDQHVFYHHPDLVLYNTQNNHGYHSPVSDQALYSNSSSLDHLVNNNLSSNNKHNNTSVKTPFQHNQLNSTHRSTVQGSKSEGTPKNSNSSKQGMFTNFAQFPSDSHYEVSRVYG